jgi:hypothetical protein
LQLTVTNKVPARKFSLGTSFPTVILWEPSFLATIFRKNLVPQIPLEITIRNEVPAGIFSLETSILTDISKGT